VPVPLPLPLPLPPPLPLPLPLLVPLPLPLPLPMPVLGRCWRIAATGAAAYAPLVEVGAVDVEVTRRMPTSAPLERDRAGPP